MLNSKFCVRPFVHSLVETNGKLRPCCRSIPVSDFTGRTDYNINTDTVDNWWHSPYMDYLRSNMLNGTASAECERCYRQEEFGATSFRQLSNKEFGIVTEPDVAPRDWEFQITNLCNLKCMMCSSQNSSTLLNENVILFGAEDTQKQYQWNTHSHEIIRRQFETLTSAVIRGGEPFMVPWVKELLANIPASRAKEITLLFNTNLTKFNAEWAEILSKFKLIKFSCSVDAVDNLNYYIRFPSDWTTVTESISLMRTMPNTNVFLNTCVQNLNVLHIDQLLLWAQANGLYVVLDTLTEPDLFEISNLPPALTQLAITRIESVLPKLDSNMVPGIDGVLKMLYNSKSDSDKWKQFVEMVNTRDQHRGVSVLDVVPEFTEYWNA